MAVLKRALAGRTDRAGCDVLDDVDEWLEQEEYAKEFPKLVEPHSLKWDIRNRRLNGLEGLGAIRKVGRRFLVHRRRYTAYRLGELRP